MKSEAEKEAKGLHEELDDWMRDTVQIDIGRKDKVYTGVYSIHSFEFIHEETQAGIDLSWENAVTDYMAEHQNTREAAELAVAYMEMDSDTYLIGFRHDKGRDQFVEDPEADYSAIVRYDAFMTVQVTRSKWVTTGAPCSPCFPGQIDGDSPGDFKCYAPDPEIIGDAGDQELKDSIYLIAESYDRTVRIDQIVLHWDIDKDADARDYDCYDEEQIEAYDRGDWAFYCCRAAGWVSYQCNADGTRRLEQLSSGGLYGINLAEPPQHDSYAREVEQEELAELKEHLSAFGVDLSNFDEKAKEAKRVTP